MTNLKIKEILIYILLNKHGRVCDIAKYNINNYRAQKLRIALVKHPNFDRKAPRSPYMKY